MPFQTTCPVCKAKLRVKDKLKGRFITCPKCMDCTYPAHPDPEPSVEKAEPEPVVESPAEPTNVEEAASPEGVESAKSGPRRRKKNARTPKGVVSWCHLALVAGSLAVLLSGVTNWLLVPALLGAAGFFGAIAVIIFADERWKLAPSTWIAFGASVIALIQIAIAASPHRRGYTSAADIPVAKETIPFPNRELRRVGPSDDWLNAQEVAVEQGGLCLGVDSVYQAQVEKTVNGQPTTGRRAVGLIIHLRLVPTERVPAQVPFAAWSEAKSPPAGGVTLSASPKQPLALLSIPPGAAIVNHPKQTTFFPRMYIEDVLVFEAPRGSVESLRLTVPAAAFGGNGTIKFVIPSQMIEK
jgi:hypothetical protein